jgi:hypothetical protein
MFNQNPSSGPAADIVDGKTYNGIDIKEKS